MPRAFATTGLLLASASILAQGKQWPYSMDYGPCLMTTFEGGGQSGDTMKGVVVELGADEKGGAVASDTELLRLSAAWIDGWRRLRGAAYDGAHGPFLAIAGMQPVHQMRITCNVDGASGERWKGAPHNTIHELGENPGFEGGR